MIASQAAVLSSFGSRRPEDDRQCAHARLHAYVSSHVRQIGAFSPYSNCSINEPPTGRFSPTVIADRPLRTWVGSCPCPPGRAVRRRTPATATPAHRQPPAP